MPSWERERTFLERKRLDEANEDEKKAHDNILKLMAPADTLRLPQLLEQRRWEIGITDGAFKQQASYDRILVHQLDYRDSGGSKFFKDGLIERPDTVRASHEAEAPRGCIVSAGLLALDTLRSNGMDLGHIVTFQRIATYRIRCDQVNNKIRYLLVLLVGDICSSEDTASNILRGNAIVDMGETKEGQMQHVMLGADKKRWTPTRPWSPDDL